MIGFIIAVIVIAGITKGTVDFVKQLRKDVRRRDEGRRVMEYARLHGISVSEAHKILNNE